MTLRNSPPILQYEFRQKTGEFAQETGMPNGRSFREHMRRSGKYMVKLQEHHAKLNEAFWQVSAEAMKNGALDRKTMELIALAMVVEMAHGSVPSSSGGVTCEAIQGDARSLVSRGLPVRSIAGCRGSNMPPGA